MCVKYNEVAAKHARFRVTRTRSVAHNRTECMALHFSHKLSVTTGSNQPTNQPQGEMVEGGEYRTKTVNATYPPLCVCLPCHKNGLTLFKC